MSPPPVDPLPDTSAAVAPVASAAEILAALPQGVELADVNGLVRYSSAAAQRLYGVERSGRPVWAVGAVAPAEAARLEREWRRVLRDRPAPATVFANVGAAAGAARSLALRWSYLYDDRGVVSGIVVDVRDAAECSAVARDGEGLAAAVDAAADAMVITDAGGLIVRVNPAYTRITGYTAEELRGRTNRVLRSDLHSAQFYTMMWRQISSGQPWSGRLVNRRKDGSLYHAALQIAPVLDVHGQITGFVGVQRDVSDDIAREQKLRDYAQAQRAANFKLQAQQEQMQAQQIELEAMNRELTAARDAAEAGSRAKSGFLANMSHEIRTPMTAILGYADLLGEMTTDGPAREYLATIQRNGEHLLRIINDILDLSKIEAGKLVLERVACAPVDVLEDVAGLMSLRAREKGLELIVEKSLPLPARIRTDPLRLRQILVNLVGNAIKFTTRGAVTVSLRMTARTADVGPALEFAIADTGDGIPPEVLGRLFRPFSQGDASTTRRFGGTGLGLAISQQLARGLGGDIVAESVPGGGATFRCVLPLEDADLVALLTTTPAAPATAPNKPVVVPAHSLQGRVLVAEDGPDNQRLICRLLTRLGLRVQVVDDGQGAVDAALAALADAAAFDLILMDVQMPRMDGLQATELLRGRGYGAPIVALTAHAMAGERERCLAAGCDEYLSKPIDRRALETTLAHFLQRRPNPVAISADD